MLLQMNIEHPASNVEWGKVKRSSYDGLSEANPPKALCVVVAPAQQRMREKRL
jgi:hypothetical protein